MTNLVSKCEVCGNNELHNVLDLGCHPLCDDLIPIGDKRESSEFPIKILFCQVCRTAHQQYQVPKRVLFPGTYHYRSRFTQDVMNGMKQLVSECEDFIRGLPGKRVLDIGCNDGSLLGLFRGKGAVTIGIEPTDACHDSPAGEHHIYKEYLSPSLASQIVSENGQPDIIVFTNVFAHIEDLNSAIESIRILSSQETLLVIENHYLGSILSGNQFDTFYHEHPRTYSYTSFVYIAKSLKMDILNVDFPSRYGGNIRVLMRRQPLSSDLSVAMNTELLNSEARFASEFQKLQTVIEIWKLKKGKTIASLIEKRGKIRAKAFPGRSAILVKMLGLDSNSISAVYEKDGSVKIGNYVPGTTIPILSDAILFGSDSLSEPILNFAWHISDEIRTYLAAHKYTGQVYDILAPNDFEL
jgi:hypothetical protein